MKTVSVSATTQYDVKIGAGLLAALGQEAKAVTAGTSAVIVSDSHVWPLWGAQAEASLQRSGFSVFSFVIIAGESSKNAENYIKLLNFLAECHITRSDFLVALGGGVVGDLCGFAAATFLRGMDYIQIPTTLLAMVDSSVGGKTAIDLPAGKNLAGAFHQPRLVLCDTALLATLPEAVFLDGCGEVIKYAVAFDPALFDHLMEKGIAFDREAVITRCVELKKSVVEADEFDRGTRRVLNLGHTFAHSIEKESHYTLSHGSAVAMGICMAARFACARQVCSADTAKAICALVARFGLPTQPPYSAEALAFHALSDKKRAGNCITLGLPATVGCCQLLDIPVSQLKDCMEVSLWM